MTNQKFKKDEIVFLKKPKNNFIKATIIDYGYNVKSELWYAVCIDEAKAEFWCPMYPEKEILSIKDYRKLKLQKLQEEKFPKNFFIKISNFFPKKIFHF